MKANEARKKLDEQLKEKGKELDTLKNSGASGGAAEAIDVHIGKYLVYKTEDMNSVLTVQTMARGLLTPAARSSSPEAPSP